MSAEPEMTAPNVAQESDIAEDGALLNGGELTREFEEATANLDELSRIRNKEVDEVAGQVAKVAGATTGAGQVVAARLEKKHADKKQEAEMTLQAKTHLVEIQRIALEMGGNLDEQQARIGDLQASLDVKGEMVASLEKAVAERDERIDALEIDLKSSQDAEAAVKLQLDEKSAAFDEKAIALSEQTADFEETQQELSEKKTLLDETQAELENAQKNAADEAAQKLEEAASTKEEMLAAFEAEKAALQKKLGEAEGSAFLLGDTVKTLQADLKKAETELEVKENSNSAREQEYKVARERFEEEKAQLDELLRKKSATIDELQALVGVLSGDEDAALMSAEPEVVSLPGAAPKDENTADDVLDAAPVEVELQPVVKVEGGVTLEMNVEDVMPPPSQGEQAPMMTEGAAPKNAAGSWADSVADSAELGDDRAKDAFWESSRASAVVAESAPSIEPPAELTLDMVVKATDKLDGTAWQSPEEIKLAGVLAHQAWRVEEVAKLTRLDSELVRVKLTEFAHRGLIQVVG